MSAARCDTTMQSGFLGWTWTLTSFYWTQVNSSGFPNLSLELRPDAEIVLISDQIPSLHLLGEFRKLKIVQLKSAQSLLGLRFKHEPAVTFVVTMFNVTETLRTIEVIGNLSSNKHVIVTWPNAIKIDDLQKMWRANADFHRALVKFQLDSRFLMVVPVTTGSSVVYYMYTIHKSIVIREVSTEDQWDVMACGICSTSVHAMNALQEMLVVQDATDGGKGNESLIFPRETFAKGPFVQQYLLALFTTIEMKWNFTVQFVKSRTKETQLDDGSWIGVVQDVETGVADVGMSVGLIRKSKGNQVAFLPTLGEDFISAFFLQPEENTIRDIFFEPFQHALWIVTLGTWLLLATSMTLISILRQRLCSDQTPELDQSSDSFLIMLGTATQQGWEEHPIAISLRTILICASIMGVIVYAGYSAAIVSTLSMKREPITTPEQLLRSNLRIGVRDDYSRRDWNFQADDTDSYAALINRISTREGEGLVNGTRALYLIQTQPYAYVTSHVRMYESCRSKVPPEDLCAITELPVLKQRFQFGMFTAKRSPIREVLRRIFLLLKERGLLWRLRRKFLYVRRCEHEFDNSGHALGLHDVFSAFVLLSIGYLLSVSFLIMEKGVYRRFNTYID